MAWTPSWRSFLLVLLVANGAFLMLFYGHITSTSSSRLSGVVESSHDDGALSWAREQLHAATTLKVVGRSLAVLDEKLLSQLSTFDKPVAMSEDDVIGTRLSSVPSALMEEIQLLKGEMERERIEFAREVAHMGGAKNGLCDAPSIVTLVTNTTVKAASALVGSIHQHHPSARVIVYGLGLDHLSESHIRLWKNVEFYDVHSTFLMSSPLQRGSTNEEHPSAYYAPTWRLPVMRHAALRYEAVLFIDPVFVVTDSLHGVFLSLLEDGYFFFCGDRPATALTSVFGLRVDSVFYRETFQPYLDCINRKCSRNIGTELLFQNFEELAMCQESELFPIKLRSVDDYSQSCYLDFRKDFLISLGRLPYSNTWGVPGAAPSDGTPKPKTKIVLGVPTHSGGEMELGSLPFVSQFLETLKDSMNTPADEDFQVDIYLAYDEGDPFYDTPTGLRKLEAKFERDFLGTDVKLVLFRMAPTRGWLVFLWNALFEYAVEDGADYFYQANDDLRFISKGWAYGLTQRLQTNPIVSNFGVTGPIDKNHASLLTQAFVHRTHYDIFGFLYPPRFRNWWSDDWLTRVYADHDSLFAKSSVYVENTNVKGTRYEICNNAGAAVLEQELESSKVLIDKWLEDHRAGKGVRPV